MHYRDDLKRTRERLVDLEMRKLELRAARRQRSSRRRDIRQPRIQTGTRRTSS